MAEQHLIRLTLEPRTVTPGEWVCSGCDWVVRAYDEQIAYDSHTVAHPKRCPSENVKCDPAGTNLPLLRYPCVRFGDHRGRCRAEDGSTWLRLSEGLREQGFELAGGGRVRRLRKAS